MLASLCLYFSNNHLHKFTECHLPCDIHSGVVHIKCVCHRWRDRERARWRGKESFCRYRHMEIYLNHEIGNKQGKSNNKREIRKFISKSGAHKLCCSALDNASNDSNGLILNIQIKTFDLMNNYVNRNREWTSKCRKTVNNSDSNSMRGNYLFFNDH